MFHILRFADHFLCSDQLEADKGARCEKEREKESQGERDTRKSFLQAK